MPGTLIVSLDFELYWGMRDVVTLEQYTPNMLDACMESYSPRQ